MHKLMVLRHVPIWLFVLASHDDHRIKWVPIPMTSDPRMTHPYVGTTAVWPSPLSHRPRTSTVR